MDTSTNLHRARLARNLDLSRISAVTALSPSIVRKIDEGRYDELPGGLYARSYVRAFAEAVGVPPEAAIHELEAHLPAAPDPLPALREHAGADVIEIVRERMKRVYRGTIAFVQRSAAPAEQVAASPRLRRLSAAVIDALFLTGLVLATTILTAWTCGVTVSAIVEKAGLALALMCGILVAAYFVLFQGIGGRTPGALACRMPLDHEPRELRLDMITARMFRTN